MLHPEVTVEGAGIQVPQQLQVQISLSVTINIAPRTARRQVTVWLVDEIGNLLMGGEPQLVIGQRTVWRVPAMLGSARRGQMGTAGTVDVDADTGELLITPGLREEILENAKHLAGSPLSTVE